MDYRMLNNGKGISLQFASIEELNNFENFIKNENNYLYSRLKQYKNNKYVVDPYVIAVVVWYEDIPKLISVLYDYLITTEPNLFDGYKNSNKNIMKWLLVQLALLKSNKEKLLLLDDKLRENKQDVEKDRRHAILNYINTLNPNNINYNDLIYYLTESNECINNAEALLKN